MNIVKTGLLAVAALTTTYMVQAQTADDVINKHIAAIGGKEKIAGMKSIYMEGAMDIMGNAAPTVTYLMNGKGYKTEMDFNGQKIIQAMNQTGGWQVNPMMGSTTPTALPEEQYKGAKDQIFIGGALYDYNSKGSKAELAGTEKVNGVDALKLKLTSKEGVASTYYIDPSTYYITKMVRTANMGGQEAQIETVFSDYRKSDYGYVIPYKTEITLPQGFTLTSNVSKVEINKDIDPKIFEMPAK